jgi:hypothetical protein
MSNAVLLLADILLTASVFVIAYKSKHPLCWLAFIPIGNLWLMLDMVDAPIWYLVLFFVPIVNILVYVWIWMKISENTNKSEWLGLLMIVPFVNVAVALYMAFYEPEIIR